MMLRSIKILLVVTVAAFGFVGAFGNLVDWQGTYGAIAATTSMTTWDGGEASWQATASPLVVYPGAVLIPTLKTAFAVLCSIGAWRMWQTRKEGGPAFEFAKTYALAGCGLAIFMLFAGWIVIAETWFELWRSDVLRDAAPGIRVPLRRVRRPRCTVRGHARRPVDQSDASTVKQRLRCSSTGP